MEQDRATEPAVLIIAEHASAQFGGEAILPLHYFRLLRRRGIDARLIVHARTRDELTALFPQDRNRLYFVPDLPVHRFLDRWGRRLPPVVEHYTLGWISRLLSQKIARKIARDVIREHAIQIIHQPIPVSPKETSLLYAMGVPVIMGPMNGGMRYPAGFGQDKADEGWSTAIAKKFSQLLNHLLPGKLRADVLLVANDRTRQALPAGIRGEIRTLVENGVDLSLWSPAPDRASGASPTRFVFTGRLVDWKAIDLLLEAFAGVVGQTPATLELIGDGPVRALLEAQVTRLNLQLSVIFSGWQPQKACAERLRSADALVLPSLKECGGAVILEAMAVGLPVIATAWGGPVDYLDPTCGILVPPTSRQSLIDGLRDAMLRLARDPALRQTLGKAGRQKVVELFDWERKIDQILAIYAQTITKRR